MKPSYVNEKGERVPYCGPDITETPPKSALGHSSIPPSRRNGQLPISLLDISQITKALNEGMAKRIKEESEGNKEKKTSFRMSQKLYNRLEEISERERFSISQLLTYAVSQFIEIYDDRYYQEKVRSFEKSKAIKAEFESFPIEIQEQIRLREVQEPENDRHYDRAIKEVAEWLNGNTRGANK